MMQRLNPFTTAPDGVAALINVEKYLQTCGLDHKLITLVKTRVSQINGCAYCLHMHTEEARKLGETEVRLYLLDAWYEFEPLFGARAGSPGLGGIADEHCSHTRARPRLRRGAATFLGEGIGGPVDRDRHDQCLEPPGNRFAIGPCSRYREGGMTTVRLRESCQVAIST